MCHSRAAPSLRSGRRAAAPGLPVRHPQVDGPAFDVDFADRKLLRQPAQAGSHGQQFVLHPATRGTLVEVGLHRAGIRLPKGAVEQF
jgi:hypothetical protein